MNIMIKSGNKHSELIGNYQPGASYNYDIDETGQYAADNGEYNKCGTVTMKAQWVQLYTVKYDGNHQRSKVLCHRFCSKSDTGTG